MPPNRLRSSSGSRSNEPATRAQGIERCRQVSAIYRRNGDGPNRRERARVVPVVDVAAELLQLVVGLQAALAEFKKLRNAQIAERNRGLSRIEQQPIVRGRNASRFKQPLFLDIVRDHVVVALAAELVKVPPGLQRQLPQKSIFFLGELRPGLLRWIVQPRGDATRKSPKEKNRQGYQHRLRMVQKHHHAHDQRDQGTHGQVAVNRRAPFCRTLLPQQQFPIPAIAAR